MRIGARVTNSEGQREVNLTTNGAHHALEVPPRASGFGSSVNGGKLLVLALATCSCNDIYREAATRGIAVEQVELDGTLGGDGESGRDIT